MEKIIIDSANFFDMLSYYQIFKQYGISSLKNVINEHKKTTEEQKQILLDMFSQEYKQEYPNEQFYKLKDFYATYLENQIDKLVMVEIGLLEYENDTLSEIFGQEHEATLSKFAELEEAKQNVKNIEQLIKQYNAEKLLYDCFSQVVCAGEILQNILQGKYKVYITYSTLCEILNYISKTQNIDEKNQVQDFLQGFTVLGIKNKKICGLIDEIAQKYRTENQDAMLPYSQRKFILPYTVAVTFAEANIAGINILSQDI